MTRCQKNIALIRAYTFCMSSIYLLPVLIPYYRDILHLGFHDFMIGESFFSAVIIAMDVPTGWISDVWKRKNVLALGMVIEILGYGQLMLAHSLIGAILAQSTIGVAVSLISGTINAIHYDSLLEGGREGEFRRLEGFRHGFGLYVIGAASIAGGFLYSINHHLPIAFTLASYAIGIVVALSMHEPARVKRAVEKHPVRDMVETVRYTLQGHPEIAALILFAAVTFAATKVMMWSQQPYYALLHLPEAHFGLLIAGGFLIGGLSAHFGHTIDGKIADLTVMAILVGIVALACVGAGIAPGLHGVPLLLSGSALYGFGWPRIHAAINRKVDSGRRATILSSANLAVNLGFIPLSLAASTVADRGGIGAALVGLGLAVAVVGGGLLAAMGLKYKQNRAEA